jgi:hypothetical protein
MAGHNPVLQWEYASVEALDPETQGFCVVL